MFGAIYGLFATGDGFFTGLNLTISAWLIGLLKTTGLAPAAFIALAILIIIAISVPFFITGFFARRGYLYALLAGTGLYVIDFGLLIFYGQTTLTTIESVRSLIIIHALMLAMLVLAIILYFSLKKLQKALDQATSPSEQ